MALPVFLFIIFCFVFFSFMFVEPCFVTTIKKTYYYATSYQRFVVNFLRIINETELYIRTIYATSILTDIPNWVKIL